MEADLKCPICGGAVAKVEAALNRTWGNAILTAWGSSQLQIRQPGGDWKPFMKPLRSAEGLFCEDCGALTIAPTLKVKPS